MKCSNIMPLLAVASMFAALNACDRFAGEIQYLGFLINRTDAPVQPAGPTVTIVTNEHGFLSISSGAIASTVLSWVADHSGSYEIKIGGVSCNDGTVLEAGTMQAGTTQTSSPILASDLSTGSNQVRVCTNATASGLTASAAVAIVRDDLPPEVLASPGSGMYGSATEVQLQCSDHGGSGCDGVVYSTNATDPAIDGMTGNVTSGVLYSDRIALADPATTAVKFRARDRAGNVGTITTTTYTVDTVVPTISVFPESVLLARFNETLTDKTIQWSSNRSGDFNIMQGGTDCTDGTTIAGIGLTGSVTAGATQTAMLADATERTSNTVLRICVRNLIGSYGFTEVTFVYDVTKPYIVSVTPEPASTNQDVLNDLVQVKFSKAMNTSAQPPLSVSILRTAPSTYVNAPVTTSYSWNSDRTVLTMRTGWVRFPENAGIQWSVETSSMTDIAGNSMDLTSNPLPATFQTGLDRRALPLYDTGITVCRNNSGSVIDCSSTEFPGQDGAYSTGPVLSFNGPTAPPGFPSDFVTTEAVTGLTWRSCRLGYSLVSGSCIFDGASYSLTWENALNACAALNSANAGAGYAGIKNWRLPDQNELRTVGTFGNAPYMDAALFPFLATQLWSSTGLSSNGTTFQSGFYNMTQGMLYLTARSASYAVLCVSGDGNRRAGGFVDHHNGTVMDTRTGLMWQRCLTGQVYDPLSDTCGGTLTVTAWGVNLQACDSLTLASYSDWRLPNAVEMDTLVDAGRFPFIDTDLFFAGPVTNASAPGVHSSTMTPTGRAVFTFFTIGLQRVPLTTGTSAIARCVRGP